MYFAPGSAEDRNYKSLSFRFDLPGRSIVYTGDTGPSAAVETLAKGADLLVSNFVERVALRWWLFALCGAVVLLIVCAVQLVRTWRIANANPINMIKTE